jgi:uncharacterized protein YfdQ (DUF2303 family)
VTAIEKFDGVDPHAVVAHLAEQNASGRQVIDLVDDRLVALVLAEGQSVHEVNLDQYADAPSRMKGLVAVADAESFVLYVERHKSMTATTLWGDLDKGSVTAVLDDHDGTNEYAGWGEHRALLALPATPDWEHWLKLDGTLVSQEQFAEHLEDGAHCIADPDPATMMEIAQTFQARTGVEFKAGHRTQSGETKLQYEETTTARAGQAGSIDIPDSMRLRLQPFEGSPTYELLARFRYRIQSGGLKLGYRLVRPDAAKRQAFRDIVSSITDRTGLPVHMGVPRR